MNVLEIKKLCKNFENITAINNASFTARQGEIIALLGPNGAGKSTLMNITAGFLSPTSGEIKILGKNISAHSLFAKENIGFLPEGAPLYPDLSVKSFLYYLAELKGLPHSAADQAIKVANLEKVAGQKIETLSKGYQRRTGFAQSILSMPPLLLLDEPTDGLDPNQKDHIRGIIKDMGHRQTFLISTHLLEEAETIATRIIVMDKGIIKADGTLNEILEKSKTHSLHDAFKTLTTEKKNV